MKQLINIGKVFLLVLFISSHISTTAFRHTHYFSWGIVTHSHPYLPSSDKNPESHTHTQSECLLISVLSNLVQTGAIVGIAFFIFDAFFIRKIYTWVGNYKSYAYPIFLPLRAPPVTVSHQ